MTSVSIFAHSNLILDYPGTWPFGLCGLYHLNKYAFGGWILSQQGS